jgi:PAS domain S-box-containing protein
MSARVPDPSFTGDALREKARHWLAEHRTAVPDQARLSPVELIAELQIHQAELEMQNQQLREAQTALDQARHRYFTLFDLSPNSYFVFNRAHAIHELNLAAAELLGIDRIQAKNRPFFLYLADESRAEFHRHLNDAFAKKTKHSVDLRLKAPSGGVRDIYFESHLLTGDLGGETLCLSAGFDITDRKRAESALRESEERFRILAETVPTLIWLLDARRCISSTAPGSTSQAIPSRRICARAGPT